MDEDNDMIKAHLNPLAKEGQGNLLIEIHTDIKWIKKELEEMKESTREQLKEHDERIAKLEEFKYKVVGALVVIYFIVMVMMALMR